MPTDVADQFGVPIPEAQLVGEGEVWVLTGGGTSPHGLVQGRWKKTSLEAVTTYTDADGNPILLTPGRTWVVLPVAGRCHEALGRPFRLRDPNGRPVRSDHGRRRPPTASPTTPAPPA